MGDIASEDEHLLHQMIEQRRGSRFSQYRIEDLIPVIGTPPAGLAPGSSLVRLESNSPILLAEEALFSDKAPLVIFRGVTQHLDGFPI